jgi:hypothetical protein
MSPWPPLRSNEFTAGGLAVEPTLTLSLRSGLTAAAGPAQFLTVIELEGCAMRVDVRRIETTKGLFFTKPVFRVEYRVIFSEDELAVIHRRRLGDFVIFERKNDVYYPLTGETTDSVLKINYLLRKGPCIKTFDTLSAAMEFERQLKEEHLPRLSAFLKGNMQTGTSSDKYEL